jgi:hypothetical protein
MFKPALAVSAEEDESLTGIIPTSHFNQPKFDRKPPVQGFAGQADWSWGYDLCQLKFRNSPDNFQLRP